MKKTLLLLCTISVHSYAQQADITSPYIWCEEEVVDTAKAIAAAKQIKDETEKKITAQLELVASMREKKRKVKSEEEKALLKDLQQQCSGVPAAIPAARKAITDAYFAAYRRRWLNKELPDEIAEELEKGKVHAYFYNAFEYIQEYLSTELVRISDSDINMDFADYVSPLPTKLMNVRHDNPDYADPNFHWLDRFDTKTLEHKSVSFPVKEDYWVSSKYTEYKFHKLENMDFYSSTWAVYDQSNKLVAILNPKTTTDRGENDELQFACAKYDYERNAYDINSQPAAIKNYVAQAFATGKSLKARRDEIEEAVFLKGMEVQVAATSKRISDSQYNKLKSDFEALLAKSEKERAEIDKSCPKDVMEKGENYIDQLKKDNAYPWRKLIATRIDGLNFMLTLPDGNKLKAQAIFGYNTKDEKAECSYVVLEK